MTKCPFLSIIIPVYNVENYVEQCIASCFSQDLPLSEFELIIINDGSPDRSLDIIMKFVEIYPNIVVINQENQGLSVARNVGTQQAQGDYIWFVDSDDWIKTNCLSSIIHLLKRDNPDLLVVNHISAFQQKNYYRFEYARELKLFNPEKVYDGYQYLKMGMSHITAWGVIINKDFWLKSSFLFYSGILHEDVELMPRVYSEAKKIRYYDAYPYYYRRNRDGSVMSSISEKRIVSCLLVVESLFNYAEKINDARSPLIYRIASSTLEHCYQLISISCHEETYTSIFNNFIQKNPKMLLSFKRSKTFKTNIVYIIYFLCPFLSYKEKFELKNRLCIYYNNMKKLMTNFYN